MRGKSPAKKSWMYTNMMMIKLALLLRHQIKSITIIDDSLLKDIKAFKMRNALSSNEKIYIKSFPGATTEDMRDYIKPSLKYNSGIQVNDFLKIKTSQYGLGFIANNNFKTNFHLNNSGLHLNFTGTNTFGNNILNYIKI